MFGPHCFYCGTHLPVDNPIDHVLPWSLVGIDGLANLVIACQRCNGDKSNALPATPLIDWALEDQRLSVLEDIATRLQSCEASQLSHAHTRGRSKSANSHPWIRVK